EIDQHGANLAPRRDPPEHMNEPRRIAAQLAGADVAEIEGSMAALRQLVEHLHAQARAGREEPDLAVGIDHDEVEAVVELERRLGVGFGATTDEIAQARLADERVVVNGELEVAYGPG